MQWLIGLVTAITVLFLSGAYWWYRNQENEEKPQPKPIDPPPVPTEPFDQYFTSYSVKHGQPIFENHKKCSEGEKHCRFIQRTLHDCSPKTVKPTDPTVQLPEQYEKFMSLTEGSRTYLLHVPAGLHLDLPVVHREFGPSGAQKTKTTNSPSVPLLLLIHGTDETAFDGELLNQFSKQQSWLDLSDKENIVLLFAQARGLWSERLSCWRPPGDYLKTLWLPSSTDPNEVDSYYFGKAIDDAVQICPSIDKNRIYVIGFSNGGFMACDIALSFARNIPKIKPKTDSPKLERASSGQITRTFSGLKLERSGSSSKIERTPSGPLKVERKKKLYQGILPTFKYPVAGVCLYMGGINGQQMGITLGIDKYQLPNINSLIAKGPGMIENLDITKGKKFNVPKVLVVTGTLDVQVFSSMNAFQTFYQLGFPTQLINMPDKTHEYQAESTQVIWNFFSS